MNTYDYQNELIGKKQLRQLLAWSFTNYDSMQACLLADELKYLGFKYATQSGISISIEDLKIPFVKMVMLDKANQEIRNSEKIYLKGKITDVERFQKIIDTWSLTSESLKDQIIYYFKNYDPLNSVYIMAFSGARGNLSQVRQLVGMRGLMSDPSGQIMNLPIKKNFREGLTVTDYLMSGYGARKGIVDTALKTANSGYLTRRLIDVAQDILIREKDCLTLHAVLFSISDQNSQNAETIYDKILGRVLNRSIIDPKTQTTIAPVNTQITPTLIEKFKKNNINTFYVRSPLTCTLYRAVCQKCYGWDLATENLVDIGEAIGILAGQSIGEPGTQLTMRTFHTGGIFTSEARQQIISPLNGVIQFFKFLKTVIVRTNRGEDVLLTKNTGSLVLIPDANDQKLIQIEVLRNTILFPKNNQYVSKDTVIGEVINQNKQTKTEVKPILSDSSGEIFIPRLKQKINLINNNKLIWILSGKLYSSPLNSFLNFYSDYKLNKHSFIFRSKIINHYSGRVNFTNTNLNLSQNVVKVKNNIYSFQNSQIQKLTQLIDSNNYLLRLGDTHYWVKICQKQSKYYLQLTQNEKFATLVTNLFKTITGGILYYDFKTRAKSNKNKEKVVYFDRSIEFRSPAVSNSFFEDLSSNSQNLYYQQPITSNAILWLNEEVHKLDCDSTNLLVEHGDFISKGFELVPGVFSKISGLVTVVQKNNRIKTIIVKPGLVYTGRNFENIAKKLYYPGEILFPDIVVSDLGFCEHVVGKIDEQLLIRPIMLYEIPYSSSFNDSTAKKNSLDIQQIVRKFEFKLIHNYKPKQKINSNQSLNLILSILSFRKGKSVNEHMNIELVNRPKTNLIDFLLIEKLPLTNYVSPNLKYKNLQSCFLVQTQQFVSNYTTLGYLESVNIDYAEIVKFKVRKSTSKQIFLISNQDCITIEKKKLPNKELNDFITSNLDLAKIGKIIIESKNIFTIQKGRPYFFPNCQNKQLTSKINLRYKLFPLSRIQTFETNRKIWSSYHNINDASTKKIKLFNNSLNKLPKLFMKSNGKLYSSIIPYFVKSFSIKNQKLKENNHQLFPFSKTKLSNLTHVNRSIWLRRSELVSNKNKKNVTNDSKDQLTLLKITEHQDSNIAKSTKKIGLYSITEDYFEQELNSVFCKNLEFIEENKTIGLLNLEKEITGDIVQGLPRIEEILEARKKNLMTKRIPTSKKKGLLLQKTSLDTSFEFRKLGTPIKENDKINPHKLLKVYFNYYGLMKNSIPLKFNRFIRNYESSYKSFKKVQLFILHSVQSVYQSQGVTINDKHLEIIIKQMTTKVIITNEGDTPLLRREVIDLYHIQYINKILKTESKQNAYYVPLLLGITKAALNNPSFISAASFQETTRVLTKAAIEGRIDWLRGLKENIIIGHLIPTGTGSPNYRNCFKNYSNQPRQEISNFAKLETFVES